MSDEAQDALQDSGFPLPSAKGGRVIARARGGVAGYADGGSPSDDDTFLDRFAPAVEQPLGSMTRGQGLVLAAPRLTQGIAAQPTPGTQGAPIYDDGQGPFRIDPSPGPTGDATALKGPGVAPGPDADADLPDEAKPPAAVLRRPLVHLAWLLTIQASIRDHACRFCPACPGYGFRDWVWTDFAECQVWVAVGRPWYACQPLAVPRERNR